VNRRRNHTPVHRFLHFVLLAAAAIGAAGGVLIACYKNRQVRIARQIEQVEQRIAEHEDDIRTVQMRMDQMLNRYVMRDQLRDLGSIMLPIPKSAIEVVDPSSPPPSRTVASARP
jgi:hypothetical protein